MVVLGVRVCVRQSSKHAYKSLPVRLLETHEAFLQNPDVRGIVNSHVQPNQRMAAVAYTYAVEVHMNPLQLYHLFL